MLGTGYAKVVRSWRRRINCKFNRFCYTLGLPCGSAGKESSCNFGDLGSIPGSGRSPGEGKGYPLQYSGLENSRDSIVHGVTKSQAQLTNIHFHFCYIFSSVQSLSHVWLCDHIEYSTPGHPVHHQLLEFTQTHVHWVGDAIQPSSSVVPFSCSQSFPASESFQMNQLFASCGQSIGVSASHQSFQSTPRTDLL